MRDNLAIGLVSSVNLKERYTACRLTWLKDFDNTFIFAGHEANKFDNILISIENAGENWESTFLKQQMGLKYMFEQNSNFDWYCIATCDNILFKNKIIKELSTFNPDDDLFLSQPCGLWCDFPSIVEINEPKTQGITFRAIAGGASFFISNSLMKKCYNIIDEFNNLWVKISGSKYGCSDVALSYMIKKYFNIDVTHILYMLSQSPTHYDDENNKMWYDHYPVDISELLKNPMSLHYIKPSEMNDIYNQYRD